MSYVLQSASRQVQPLPLPHLVIQPPLQEVQDPEVEPMADCLLLQASRYLSARMPRALHSILLHCPCRTGLPLTASWCQKGCSCRQYDMGSYV